MPTSGGYYYWFGETDARRWERCKRQAAAKMVAEGWHPKAGKFFTVQTRRAMKLWRSS